MIDEHKIDPGTLDRMMCVTRDEGISGALMIKLVRVFVPLEAAANGIRVMGWETFDEHPEFIIYEGYLNRDYKPFLVKKRKMLHENNFC